MEIRIIKVLLYKYYATLNFSYYSLQFAKVYELCAHIKYKHFTLRRLL